MYRHNFISCFLLAQIRMPSLDRPSAVRLISSSMIQNALDRSKTEKPVGRHQWISLAKCLADSSFLVFNEIIFSFLRFSFRLFVSQAFTLFPFLIHQIMANWTTNCEATYQRALCLYSALSQLETRIFFLNSSNQDQAILPQAITKIIKICPVFQTLRIR